MSWQNPTELISTVKKSLLLWQPHVAANGLRLSVPDMNLQNVTFLMWHAFTQDDNSVLTLFPQFPQLFVNDEENLASALITGLSEK